MFSLKSKSQQTTTRTTSATTPRRQIVQRYLKREKLQTLLEQLFPTQPQLDFHIRLDNEVWSFDAPRDLTKEELKEAKAQD